MSITTDDGKKRGFTPPVIVRVDGGEPVITSSNRRETRQVRGEIQSVERVQLDVGHTSAGAVGVCVAGIAALALVATALPS